MASTRSGKTAEKSPEYVEGAFHALAWARLLLSNVKDLTGLEKAAEEIDRALDTLKGGVSPDFHRG